MKYKLIIFDFDGTLADTFDFFLDLINDMAIKHHFKTLSDDDKENIKDLSARQIIKNLKIPFWKIPKVAKSMKASLSSSNSPIEVFDFIPQILLELKNKNVNLAILTSNNQVNVKRILRNNFSLFGASTFDVSILGKKRQFKKLIKNHQVLPSEVLIIGDEVRDIEAAQNIGVDIASVCWGYNSQKILISQKPTYLIQSPQQILDIFN
jgi:phosphoglycolate phosphatase